MATHKENDDAFAAHAARCTQLLREGTPSAYRKAMDTAHECLRLDKTNVVGYVLLAKALSGMKSYDEAIAWCKKGLEIDPENGDLNRLLRDARLAVLDNLLDDDEEDEDEDEGEEEQLMIREEIVERRQEHRENRTTSVVVSTVSVGNQEQRQHERSLRAPEVMSQAVVFEEKVEQILRHLDLHKITRMAMLYVLIELLNLRSVVIGLLLFAGGLLVHAIMHRHKLMAISIVVLCLYQSTLRKKAQKYITDWAHTSTDKIGALAWAPRLIVAVPIAMKIFGHMKFMLFLQRDWALCMIVFLVTSAFVANGFRAGASPRMQEWGEGKRLKFVAYSVAILYWAGWRGEVADTFRLLAPTLIDAGGIVLSSVSSEEIQLVCRRAWTRLYNELAEDIQQNVEFDALFFFGLTNWVIDYWQQPTNFSLEMLTKMLADGFNALERRAVHIFRPEIRNLGSRLTDIKANSELALLVEYLKQSINNIPPSKLYAMIGLFSKRCPSFNVCVLLVVFYGVISVPLLPFIASEAKDAQILYDLYVKNEFASMDGLEILLLGSPLLRVWQNLKRCVYCLEGSVTLTKAVATGAHVLTAATRLSRLAVFAARVKKEGLLANAQELPDHVAQAFLISENSNVIIDGLRSIAESSHFQDLKTSIGDWWHAKRAKEDKQE